MIVPTSAQTSAHDVVSVIESYERAGFPSAWMTQSIGFDPFPILAVAGQSARTIELGTAVVPTYPRHPSVVAASALTASGLLQGRLRLGIGVSHQAAMEGRLGIPWERPAAHMEEYLEILLPLLRGERVRYRGSMLSANLSLAIPPAEHCPVYLAALQPKMLRLAGALAEGTITWCTGPITIAEQVVPGITAAARDAGRPAPRVLVALPVCVSDDEQHGRAVANQLLDGYGQLPVYRAVLDREGVQDPGDIAVVGPERAVTAQIERLFAAGATDFIAIPCGDAEDRRRSLEHLASLL